MAVSAVMKRTFLSRPPKQKFTAPGSSISPSSKPSGLSTSTPPAKVAYSRPAESAFRPSGMLRRAHVDHALAVEPAAVQDVERLEVVRLAVVGHVQRALVRREAESVGLVERVGDRDRAARSRVVSPHGVPKEWPRPEALEPAVARIREPDRAVAFHDDVVGRVEALGEQRARPAHAVHRCDRATELLADDEPAVVAEGHPVRGRGVSAHGGDGHRLEGEPLDVDARAGLPRKGREVQGVVGRHVDRPFVGVDVDHVSQARCVAQDGLELRVADDEGRGARGEVGHADRLAHIDSVHRGVRALRRRGQLRR